jgi:hypothetical protein
MRADPLGVKLCCSLCWQTTTSVRLNDGATTDSETAQAGSDEERSVLAGDKPLHSSLREENVSRAGDLAIMRESRLYLQRARNATRLA